LIRFLSFPCLKGEEGKKEGKWGKRGWKRLFFITFFNSTYPEISKKIGFRGSAFPFPPFSLLRTGRRKIK
jgi:hypothetical protein